MSLLRNRCFIRLNIFKKNRPWFDFTKRSLDNAFGLVLNTPFFMTDVLPDKILLIIILLNIPKLTGLSFYSVGTDCH